MKKEEIDINSFKMHDKDYGSSALQIIFLTQRINELNEHLKLNKKDHSGMRGLMLLVGKRRRMCKYLQRKNAHLYKQVIERANLRK